MSDLSLAIENFSKAVAALTLREGTLRERLGNARPSLIALESEDVPAVLRDQFQRFCQISDYDSAASVAPMTWRERLDGEMPTL